MYRAWSLTIPAKAEGKLKKLIDLKNTVNISKEPPIINYYDIDLDIDEDVLTRYKNLLHADFPWDLWQEGTSEIDGLNEEITTYHRPGEEDKDLHPSELTIKFEDIEKYTSLEELKEDIQKKKNSLIPSTTIEKAAEKYNKEHSENEKSPESIYLLIYIADNKYKDNKYIWAYDREEKAMKTFIQVLKDKWNSYNPVPVFDNNKRTIADCILEKKFDYKGFHLRLKKIKINDTAITIP